jgi:hypothetical protein
LLKVTRMRPFATLRVLPTSLAIEALPEFDATSRRFLAAWIKDKLLVSKTLNEQLGLPWPNETMVDNVHQRYMQNAINQ